MTISPYRTIDDLTSRPDRTPVVGRRFQCDSWQKCGLHWDVHLPARTCLHRNESTNSSPTQRMNRRSITWGPTRTQGDHNARRLDRSCGFNGRTEPDRFGHGGRSNTIGSSRNASSRNMRDRLLQPVLGKSAALKVRRPTGVWFWHDGSRYRLHGVTHDQVKAASSATPEGTKTGSRKIFKGASRRPGRSRRFGVSLEGNDSFAVSRPSRRRSPSASPTTDDSMD